eukprot:jgi/Bigna1/81784/fgenesh1_pg.84_\
MGERGAKGEMEEATYWLMSNALSPTIYNPKVPDLDRKNLGLSPKDFAKLLEDGDTVSILTADLSHLRARLVPGTKEEVLQRQSLLSEDFARKIAQTQAESSATYRRKPRLYAPCFCGRIGFQKDGEGLVLAIWLMVSGPEFLAHIATIPKVGYSNFGEVTWRNIVDLYVQRVFPGPSFANLRRKIENHRDGVIQLDHGHGDDDYGAGGGVSEQRIVWQTRNMQPINVEDYIRAEGHSDPAPTASSSSSPSPSLETTTRLLASYMGLLDQENARWHHAFRRAASEEGPRTGVRNAKADDSSEPEVSSLRSVDYERMYFVSDEAIQRLDNVEIIGNSSPDSGVGSYTSMACPAFSHSFKLVPSRGAISLSDLSASLDASLQRHMYMVWRALYCSHYIS